MLDFDQALDTSDSLAEKIASARTVGEREQLEQRKALVDCAAFELFKKANFGRALQWGAGIGLPALGVGHLLMRDARHQGHELLADARNQALLTALGVGGMQSLGGAISGAMAPSQREEMNELSLPSGDQFSGRNVVKLSSANDGTLKKLAAIITVDAFLCDQLEKAATNERDDVAECLLINRCVGIDLLRSIR